MRVVVITSLVPQKIKTFFKFLENDFIIAVDGALDELVKQKISPNLVIGDMDSINNKNLLKRFDKIILKPEKDETDTFIAIKHAYTLSEKVILLGGIKGDRIEHLIANLTLFNLYPNLIIMNENSNIYLLEKGKHVIAKVRYISFFAYEDAIITLSGFKYNLNKYSLKLYNPLGISNEITNVYGEVVIDSGRVLVIEKK